MICDRQTGIDRVYDRNGSKRGRYKCKIVSTIMGQLNLKVPNPNGALLYRGLAICIARSARLVRMTVVSDDNHSLCFTPLRQED